MTFDTKFNIYKWNWQAWAVTQTIDVDVSRFGGGVDPEHEGDGEKREDDEADRSNQDARHDACHHAVRRVDLRVMW